MHKRIRWFLATVAVLGLAFVGLPAGPAVATHNADEHSANMTLVKTLAKTGVTNSDLAFWGNRAYAGYLGGTAGGFRIIDITDPKNATVILDFSCPGSQNDISVWNNDNDAAADLLFLSVDTPRKADPATTNTDPTKCSETVPLTATSTPAEKAMSWEGVRVFDINTETAPVQIAAVPTDCGSHTHTLVPGKGANVNKLYIYVSSYPLGAVAVTTGIVGPPAGVRDNGTECLEPEPGEPKENGYHDKISIITVPLATPAAADDFTGTSPNQVYTNVKEVGMEGSTVGVRRLTPTRVFDFAACHDIAVFSELDLASASCWAEAQLWDISDPTTPDFLRRIRNPEFVDTLFHSTTFSWDGKMMALEDEAGGGGDDRCRVVDDPQGRILFYNTSANLLGTFKIPRPQPKPEVCTAHNYNFVPQTNGRHILVSAWYEGGTSVADATNPAAAKEIGFYDVKTAVPGGTTAITSDVWSSYWYNGYIYANDEHRGLDIFQLTDSRVNAAVTLPRLNPQTQESVIPQVVPSCRGQAATIMGTSGADTLTGTAGADVIVGLGGADTISGLGGDDRLCGGAGKDKVNGGAGADRMSGNRGRDRLSGGTGNDRLNGGPGFDRCAGGPGVDAVTRCEVIIG
jgi:hypothetical protein